MPTFKEELKKLLTDPVTMELFEEPILWDGHVFSSTTIKKQAQVEEEKIFIEHPLTRAHLLKEEIEHFFLSKNDTEHLSIHGAIDYIKKIFSYIDAHFTQIIDDNTLKEIFSCVGPLSATKKSSTKKDCTWQAIIEFLECKEDFELLSSAEIAEEPNNGGRLTKIQYLHKRLKVNFLNLINGSLLEAQDFISKNKSHQVGLGMCVFDTIKIGLNGDPLENILEIITYCRWIIINENVHNDPKEAPLLWAVKNDDDEVANFLIREQKELKVNINVKNEDGDTALSLALKYGHFKMVDLLIQARVEVNTRNKAGNSPIHIAVFQGDKGDTRLINKLLDTNVDVNIKNNEGFAPIHYAAILGIELFWIILDYVGVMKTLLTAKNIDINITTNDGQTALWLAANSGHLNIVNVLLRAPNIDVHIQSNDEENSTALLIAIIKKHKPIIKELLKSNLFNINLQNKKGFTALMVGAIYGDKEIMEDLLSVKNIEVNVTNTREFTALHEAVYVNNKQAVRELLDAKGINVNLGGSPSMFWDELCLMSTLPQNGMPEKGKIYLENQCDGQTKHIFLNLAGERKEAFLNIPLLQAQGLKLTQDFLNDTRICVLSEIYGGFLEKDLKSTSVIPVICMAASKGKRDIIEMLLAVKNIDVNVTTTNAETALMIAAKEGYELIINTLLTSKWVVKEINSTNLNGETALHIASKYGNHRAVATLLRVKDILVNTTSDTGDSPLSSYINLWRNGIRTRYRYVIPPHSKKPQLNVVKMFLEKKELMHVINYSNHEGYTVLHTTLLCGEVEIAKALIATGNIDVNVKTNVTNIHTPDKNGVTTIHIAAKNGYAPIVDMLIKYKANINVRCNGGVTPIYLAAKNGHHEVVTTLLNYSADINIPSNDGVLPLTIATRKGFKHIAEELEKYTKNYVRYLWWIKTMKEENKSGCYPPLNSYNNKEGVTIVTRNLLEEDGSTVITRASFKPYK